jgi:hypothetical protein
MYDLVPKINSTVNTTIIKRGRFTAISVSDIPFIFIWKYLPAYHLSG